MAKEFLIEMKYVIYASPDKVFEALTDPGIIKKWSDTKGKVEPKVNGDFEFFDGWVKGKVLDYQPGKSLSYTWKPGEWNKKTEPSTVAFIFKDHKAGTEVMLEHYNFPSEEEAEKHKEGWIDYVFEPLNDLFTS